MRITKDEVVVELRKRGYPAYLEGNVVMVGTPSDVPGIYSKISGILKELGYNASWGYGVRKEEEK